MEIQYTSHAQERGMERFGVLFTQDELMELVERIHAGDAEYIGKGNKKATIWMIEYNGQKVYPVIDFDAKFILTFLTKPMAYRTAKRNRNNLCTLI